MSLVLVKRTHTAGTKSDISSKVVSVRAQATFATVASSEDCSSLHGFFCLRLISAMPSWTKRQPSHERLDFSYNALDTRPTLDCGLQPAD